MGDFEFLVEKEEMWARMLMEVLEDNSIPCASFPVYGAAITMKSWQKEVLRVFVPAEKHQQATELLREFFSEDMSEEDKQYDV